MYIIFYILNIPLNIVNSFYERNYNIGSCKGEKEEQNGSHEHYAKEKGAMCMLKCDLFFHMLGFIKND